MSAQINIPSAPLSDEEAKAHVAAVCPALAGLTPAGLWFAFSIQHALHPVKRQGRRMYRLTPQPPTLVL